MAQNDPGDETQPRSPEKVSTTLIFDETPTPAIKLAAQWWLDTAAADFSASIPKTHEYSGQRGGSADLRLMGDNMAELLGWEGVSDATKQELAVWFYVQGKSARLVSDYQQRRPGKADTWLDLTTYCMMARRLQAAGMWP